MSRIMGRIMVMAGGTGGHVMPALAVATRLRMRGIEVLWVGVADSLEENLATRAGFEFRAIRIKGLRQSGLARAMVMPFMLASAMLQALWIFRQHKPNGVVGFGGFVSGPGGLVAVLLRRPLVIHEQNVIAGLTNRCLARYAARALSGFPTAQGIERFTWVGNPVRREIIDIPPPAARLSGRHGPLRLLIIGGSLGARVFNQRLPGLLGDEPRLQLEVRHQCGNAAIAGSAAKRISADYQKAGIRHEVCGFIDDMAPAYAWCDLVICRAGAMTVAELCAAGAAAILVPYPHAAGDHQSGNAAYLQSRSAAILAPQHEFVRGHWRERLVEFQRHRAPLIAMAQAARELARPDAAEAVARACLAAIGMDAGDAETIESGAIKPGTIAPGTLDA